MKATITRLVALTAIGWACWQAGSIGLAQTPSANLSPDLQEVVKLSQQKMSDDVITSYIKNSGKTYKLGADDIIYLNSQGVSQAVIATLLQNSAAATPPPAAPTLAAPVTSPTPTPDAASSAPQPPPLDASSAPAQTPPPTPAPVAAPEPAQVTSIPGTPPPSYPPSYAPVSSPMTPAPVLAPAGLSDNFFADGALNPYLWQTQSPVLAGVGQARGQLVYPALTFTPSGLQMSGIHREGELTGIASAASYAAPFNFSVTVTGLNQDAVPFEVYLVSPDLQQWVSISGHLGGRGERPHGGVAVGGGYEHFFGGVRIPLGGEARSPAYGIWVNHTGSGQPLGGLGYKIFENPLAGLPYTIQVSLGPDGLAAVTLLDAGRGVIAGQNVPVGTGPFYVVLASRDGPVYANWQSVQLVSTAPVVAVAPVPALAVPAVPTLDYFQSQLAPYGTWITLPDYGLCWQPAVGPAWRPYFDGGSWTYTDAGWYWQSDYPWGDIAFHYGRWAYTVTGWVWVPGYDYAPAWVVWRHADADGYVGWAPLVPGAVYINGGWRYHGVAVAADYDFGIGAGFFVFVDGGHFWDHDFHAYVVPHDRLYYVYGRSSYENHYHYENGRYYNDGMGRDRMAVLTHRDVREIQARRVEEVRHEEEHRNVVVRQEDIHAHQAGARPDAQRTVEAHGAPAPGHETAEPAHPGAEATHAGTEPAHGATPGAAPGTAPGGQKGTPQGSQKGGNSQNTKEKKPNGY